MGQMMPTFYMRDPELRPKTNQQDQIRAKKQRDAEAVARAAEAESQSQPQAMNEVVIDTAVSKPQPDIHDKKLKGKSSKTGKKEDPPRGTSPKRPDKEKKQCGNLCAKKSKSSEAACKKDSKPKVKGTDSKKKMKQDIVLEDTIMFPQVAWYNLPRQWRLMKYMRWCLEGDRNLSDDFTHSPLGICLLCFLVLCLVCVLLSPLFARQLKMSKK